ncbi:MAG: hypothetical protein ACE5HV_17950, partial [Acidobacteriota bacterium]
RLGSLSGLRPGASVAAIGVPARPVGSPLPVGTILSVNTSTSSIQVGWGAQEVAWLAAWGPARALVPVAVREYRLRPLGAGMQLRRRDVGGSWQPLGEGLRNMSFTYFLDRDGDGRIEAPVVATLPAGGEESIRLVAVEVEVWSPSSGAALAEGWVLLRP